MDEWAIKKNAEKIALAYDQSVANINAFKALVK